MTDTPAILGGEPLFDPPLAFAKPTLEEPSRVERLIGESLVSGRLTSGPVVAELEARVAERLGVAHCVAVASCTTGLMLVIQALGGRGLRVAVPSFTFSATAHAVAWNGGVPVFVEALEDTWTIDPAAIPAGVDAILAVHVSGVPADVAALGTVAAERGVPLVYDAAHGAGSATVVDGRLVELGGFGMAEVFSLTPTKVLSGAEGGLVTTNDAALADRLRQARNYGNPGDYDTRFAGLNGRLSELHAALALVALDHLDERVAHRDLVAGTYRRLLGEVPGVTFQQTRPGDRSSHKDFSILVDAEAFGMGRDALVAALDAEGVETRKYYSPPVHRQQAYAAIASPELPITDRLAARVVSLPIWSHLPIEAVERVAHAIARIQSHAATIVEKVPATGAVG